MPSLVPALINLYIPLIGWTLFGWLLGRYLSKPATTSLGKFLFWFGVPISIVAFLRGAHLSGWMWISPFTAWLAIFLGGILAWIWIDLGVNDQRLRSLSQGLESITEDASKSYPGTSTSSSPEWQKPTQGSFFLAMTCGNTAYLGYPVILSLVGSEYFAWGLFYDLFGSFFGVYVLGVALASYFGTGVKRRLETLQAILKNPALWSLVFGLIFRNIPLPLLAEQTLKQAAWVVVNLSLIMIGMQLGQLSSLHHIKKALTCLSIKMLLVPLVVGTGLMFFGVEGQPRMILVLQMAMPPSFATLVVAQAYNLDRDLTVTTIALGCLSLLVTLPIWVLLFGY